MLLLVTFLHGGNFVVKPFAILISGVCGEKSKWEWKEHIFIIMLHCNILYAWILCWSVCMYLDTVRRPAKLSAVSLFSAVYFQVLLVLYQNSCHSWPALCAGQQRSRPLSLRLWSMETSVADTRYPLQSIARSTQHFSSVEAWCKVRCGSTCGPFTALFCLSINRILWSHVVAAQWLVLRICSFSMSYINMFKLHVK